MRVLLIGGRKKEWDLLREVSSLEILAIYSQKKSRENLLSSSSLSTSSSMDRVPAVDFVLELEPSKEIVEEVMARQREALLLPSTSMYFFLQILKREAPFSLYRSAKEMEVIIDSTHDGMIAIDSKRRITLFNQAAERMTGLKAQDVLQKDVTEVIPNTRLHQVLKTGREEINQLQRTDRATIITNRVPVRNHRGAIMGAVAVFRDISEVMSLAEELTDLREVRSLLEAIINSTQDAISVVDEKGLGILINPAYTMLTGLTEEDVIGKPATVDIAEGESMHYRVLKERRPITGSMMKVGPKKKEVIVDVAPIMVKGTFKGSVGVIHDVSEIKRLTEELDQAKRLIRKLRAKYTFDDIIGKSQGIQLAKEQAKRSAQTPVTVLLRGESGTGKELFAHAIHNSSPRAKNQFVSVNCTAITSSLLESELFGYEGGAFTGALKSGKKGYFQEAHGGTIFLDEVGKMDLNLQVKLLRVLQEKEVLPVGGTRPIPLDVRIIVATNCDLEEAIREGRFREDLYYRLNVFPIFIPPLRQRKEDIPYLVHYLIRKFNQEYGRRVRACSKEALEILHSNNWPGNIRELENSIGRAVINLDARGDVITPSHLIIPEKPWKEEPIKTSAHISHQEILDHSLSHLLEKREKEILAKALHINKGHKAKTAEMLDISLRSLYYKLKDHHL